MKNEQTETAAGEEEQKVSATDKSEMMKKIQESSFDQLLGAKTRKGVCGLSNLGNTCFMNSGLQCLSNTVQLTKYFLMDFYRGDINKDNPLGMSGKLAKAYAGLIKDMWEGTENKTAPWDLKKTLGSKISRFSGFGQQDSAELVNYLLDLLHEDLNRVTKKPIVEMSEELNRPDHVVAKEFWDAFTARNKSIIVDLMYGQLKSTVTCHQCHNVSTTFDPFLSICLPIVKGITQELEWNVVPYDTHTFNESSSSWEQREMPVYKMMCKANLTLGEVKRSLIQKLKPDEKSDFVFFDQRQQKVISRHTDKTRCEEVDQAKVWTCVYEIRRTTPNDLIIELNPYQNKKQGRKEVVDAIDRAIPRVEAFDPNMTILQAKRQLLRHYSRFYQTEWNLEEVDDSAVNDAIEICIRENLPMVKKKKGGMEKATCEFCNQKHGQSEELCDPKINGDSLN